MRVVRFDDLVDLVPFASEWDRLAADNPFRSWSWVSTWWRHFDTDNAGHVRQLFALGVKDETDRLVAIVPWYVERSRFWGRVLRFLGTGDVCSEYLGALVEPGYEERAAAALADWLCRADTPSDRWDLAELTAVDAEDLATRLLVDALRARTLAVHCRRGPSCWRVELPSTWQEYLGKVSRSRRRKIHRAENTWIRTGRALVHVVRDDEQLAQAQDVLFDLHRRRRQSLGGTQYFASAPCTAFHRDVMASMLARDRLLLSWIEIDGAPAVAEYMFRGGGTVFGYQAGVSPELLHIEPGHLGKMVAIRRAIDDGCLAYDFLRGDEPYKSHWRAVPRTTLEFRAAAPRPSARARLRLWATGFRWKQRIKALVRPVPFPSRLEGQVEEQGLAAESLRNTRGGHEPFDSCNASAPAPAGRSMPS